MLKQLNAPFYHHPFNYASYLMNGIFKTVIFKMKNMKKIISAIGIIVIFCSIDPVPSEPFPYRPILMTRQMLESSVEMQKPTKLVKPGKIYIKGDYLLINEKYHGVHIIHNSDPSNPVKTGFLRIPGCIDIAMKENILYADNAVDLIAVDLSNPDSIIVTKRIRGIFPEFTPPGEIRIPSHFSSASRPENTIIVEWEEI